MLVNITNFALGRHFNNATFGGTRIEGMTSEEVVTLVNNELEAGNPLVDGYADFCKHVFVKNPSATKAGVALITPDNQHLLHTSYEARRETELPVLTRHFEGLDAPRAEYLDIILYSRAQLEKEGGDVPDAEWGIVSINAETQATESPVPPITMMRNALGKDQGGSGVPLDREAYMRSVAFWSTHATVR